MKTVQRVNRVVISDGRVMLHDGNIAEELKMSPIEATQLVLARGGRDKGRTPSGWQKWDIYPPAPIGYFTKSISVQSIDNATGSKVARS